MTAVHTTPATGTTAAAARRFVDEHVEPVATRIDRDGRVGEDLLDAVGARGWWAPFLPAEHGGTGLDLVTVARLHEEVGRGCSSVRSLLTVHSMVAATVLRWGDEAQRRRWLPRLARGEALAAFGLTEPGAGSDATALSTRARRTANGWVLDGVKRWITGAARADVILVFARTDVGIGAFLVPTGTPGVRITPVRDVLGTRGSLIGDVVLDGVVLNGDALVGPDGFLAGAVMTSALDIGRLSVAAGCVGIVSACLRACVAYTDRRRVGGQLLRDLPLIRAKISDMVVDVQAARLLVERAARLEDDGDAAAVRATWTAKYFASTAAARHATEAVQIHGANGCGPDYPVERLFRDAKVMEIIEGSTELQRLTIADQAYEEDAA